MDGQKVFSPQQFPLLRFTLSFLGTNHSPVLLSKILRSDCTTGTPKGQHVSCNFSRWKSLKAHFHMKIFCLEEEEEIKTPPSCDWLPLICNAKICNESHLSCTKTPYTEHFYPGPPNNTQLRVILRQSTDEKKRLGLKRHFLGVSAEWF